MVDVENWIAGNYRPDSALAIKTCQNSCVFIRFKLLKNGMVSGLAFNKNIPLFITNALTKAIHDMNTTANFSKDLLSDETVYLLPFIYNYQAGCQTIAIPKKFTIIQKDSKGDVLDSELQGEAILNMLNFTDGKYEALDCIILLPIRTGNSRESGYN